MTVHEIRVFLDTHNVKMRDKMEEQAQIIRISVNSAMSGKPIKLFEEDSPKVKRVTLQERYEELKALDDLGL